MAVAVIDRPDPLRTRATGGPVKTKKANSYTAYSIGCAVVWAAIWIAAGTRADDGTRKAFLSAFPGWTSATIGRAVYPPPRRSRSN